MDAMAKRNNKENGLHTSINCTPPEYEVKVSFMHSKIIACFLYTLAAHNSCAHATKSSLAKVGLSSKSKSANTH